MSGAALGILLAFGAALAWAGLDAVRKGLSSKMAPVALVALMTAGQALLFAGWMAVEGPEPGAPGYWLPGGLCLALNIAANVLFVEAVRVSPLSLTIPFLSLSPVFAAVAGYLVMGEHPSLTQWAGIATVVAGALALNAGTERGLVRSFLRERGSVLMTIVAAMWAITVTLDKKAMSLASPGFHGLVQTAGVAVLTGGYLMARGRARELTGARDTKLLLLGAVVLGGVALGVQLLAVQLVLVGVVETIKRGLGLVLAVALGRLLFAEPISFRKVVAVVVMGIGTALVVLE